MKKTKTLVLMNDWKEFMDLEYSKFTVFNGSFFNLKESYFQIGK